MSGTVPTWFFFALDGAATLMLLLMIAFPFDIIIAALIWLASWKVGLL